MARCILCREQLLGNEPPEHPLLEALGGRFKVVRKLCKPCNNDRLGGGPDRELAESARFIRMMMGFRSGNRNPPPPVRRIEANGKSIRFDSGGIPSLEQQAPFIVTEAEDGWGTIEVSIRSAEDLARIIPQLAGRLGIAEDEVRALLSRGKWTHRTMPVGVVKTQMGFGGTEAIRSMAKACFVIWANHVGEDEIQHPRYDKIRSFILSGDDEMTRSLSRLDLRPWPAEFKVADNFGPFANVVYAASDVRGRVLGYFRLYGAIGWCVELASTGAPLSSVGMASNPERPAARSEELASSHPLEFSWLDSATFEVGFDVPRTVFASMLEQHTRNAYRRELAKICEAVCRRHGFENHDPIPPEQQLEIFSEIRMYADALFARATVHRSLGRHEIARMIGR